MPDGPILITTDDLVAAMNVLTLETVRALAPNPESARLALDHIGERLLSWSADLDSPGLKAALADLGHMLSPDGDAA